MYYRYKIFKKQFSLNNGETWFDTSPLETMEKYDGIYATSSDCDGQVVTPQYRWYDLDINTDYYCQDFNKYYKREKQVSYDFGQTWSAVIPEQTERGSLYEKYSSDCGISAWTVVQDDYICLEGTKYEKRQIIYSTDGGTTWNPVEPYVIESGDSLCTDCIECEYNPEYYKTQFFLFEAEEDGFFWFDGESGNTLQYSIDSGSTWTTASGDTPVIHEGEEIWWKGNLTPFSANGITQDGRNTVFDFNGAGSGFFGSTGKFKAKGNIMSLVHADNFSGQTSLSNKDFMFYRLFNNCTGLTNTENMIMPATTLSDYCYYEMFRNCENLTSVSQLPATTLTRACYGGMFAGCTSLMKTPELPASVLPEYAYFDMFDNCRNLPTATQLSATTMSRSSCENMFSGCIRLDNIQNLLSNVTTLAPHCCMSMFHNCTSLTTAPDLLAARLERTYGEWDDFDPYKTMFSHCTNLNYVKCLASQNLPKVTGTNDYYYAFGWLDDVSPTGTFVKGTGLSIERSISGIPNNWTVQNA